MPDVQHNSLLASVKCDSCPISRQLSFADRRVSEIAPHTLISVVLWHNLGKFGMEEHMFNRRFLTASTIVTMTLPGVVLIRASIPAPGGVIYDCYDTANGCSV